MATIGVTGAVLAAQAALTVASGLSAKQSADKQARQLKKVGELEAEDQRRANRRVLGAQQAAFGASGVSATAGSPLDVLADSVAEGELAALRRKFGRDSEAAALRAQGNQELTASILDAGVTVLGGLGTPKKPRGTVSKPLTRAANPGFSGARGMFDA